MHDGNHKTEKLHRRLAVVEHRHCTRKYTVTEEENSTKKYTHVEKRRQQQREKKKQKWSIRCVSPCSSMRGALKCQRWPICWQCDSGNNNKTTNKTSIHISLFARQCTTVCQTCYENWTRLNCEKPLMPYESTNAHAHLRLFNWF